MLLTKRYVYGHAANSYSGMVMVMLLSNTEV